MQPSRQKTPRITFPEGPRMSEGDREQRRPGRIISQVLPVLPVSGRPLQTQPFKVTLRTQPFKVTSIQPSKSTSIQPGRSAQPGFLGRGTYGKVTVCPGGACKRFTLPEIFFHEAAYSIYLTNLPGIVTTKKVDCQEYMILMDLYQWNLSDWVESHPINSASSNYQQNLLSYDDRNVIIMDILKGLNTLHSLGLIHGDLKPTNILVKMESNSQYRAALADFGNTGSPLYINLKFMTPFYAPEDKKVTESIDIYAFGLILLEMWQPFRSYRYPPDEIFLRARIQSSTLPQNLKSIAFRCTHPDPKKRPSARILYYELTKVRLPCLLSVTEAKELKYNVLTENLCQTLNFMRKMSRNMRLRSPERTLGAFNYLVGSQEIPHSEYIDYGTAILYLYDQIIDPSRSHEIQAYIGEDTIKQEKLYSYVCQLLGDKRGLEILIQGF